MPPACPGESRVSCYANGESAARMPPPCAVESHGMCFVKTISKSVKLHRTSRWHHLKVECQCSRVITTGQAGGIMSSDFLCKAVRSLITPGLHLVAVLASHPCYRGLVLQGTLLMFTRRHQYLFLICVICGFVFVLNYRLRSLP